MYAALKCVKGEPNPLLHWMWRERHVLGCGTYRTYCLFIQPLMAGCVPGLNQAQEHFISLRTYSSFTSCWYCILTVLQLEVLVHQMCINPLLRLVPNNTLFASVGVDLDKKHVLITPGPHCQQEPCLTTVLLKWRWWSDFPLPSLKRKRKHTGKMLPFTSCVYTCLWCILQI